MAPLPVIAICGPTGVGKSALGVQLALSLAHDHSVAATIINADSMQVYAGLDIITNKIPVPEMCGVPHQLIGFKQPRDQYLTDQWLSDAKAAIDDAHRKHQIPILVGGTTYWMHHLIFPNSLESGNSTTNEASLSSSQLSPEISQLLAELPLTLRERFDSLPQQPPSAAICPEEALSLHSLLTCLDPIAAATWHWRNTRSVLQALKFISYTGRQPSKIFSAKNNIDIAPRYRALFIWLDADPISLYPRLDTRVDEMLQQGLLDEVKQFKQSHPPPSLTKGCSNDNEQLADYTCGIYQSIGYREFDQYLNASNLLPSKALFEEALDAMKQSTREYAAQQTSAIRNNLLPIINASNRSGSSNGTLLYMLDATNVDSKIWDVNVFQPARKITKDFLSGRVLPDPCSLSDLARTRLTIDEKPIIRCECRAGNQNSLIEVSVH